MIDLSFFPIPASKFGTKENKPKLTPEVRKQIRESKHRAHTIKDVRKSRQKTDQLSEIKIRKVKEIMEKYSVNYIKNIHLISEFAVEDGVFQNVDVAKLFITSFKEKIFTV